MTALENFKKTNSTMFYAATKYLLPYVAGGIVGSVITSGIYTGAIQPSKFFAAPSNSNQSEIVEATTNESRYSIEEEFAADEPDIENEEKAYADGATFYVDSDSLVLADSINDRADEELKGFNAIRKIFEQGDVFDDLETTGHDKADIVIEALNFIRTAEDKDVATYDDYIFKLADTLPKTAAFNEIVEYLNWKRTMISNAVDIVIELAAALRRDDPKDGLDLVTRLTDLMDNYELASAVERGDTDTSEQLDRHAGQGFSSSLPKLWDTTVGERLRSHYSATSAPASAMAL